MNSKPMFQGCRMVILALLTAMASGCSRPIPIPDGPGIFQVPVFVGSPARPKPLPAKDVIPHPLLGENSVFHEEHYNSDVTDQPGPLGLDPEVLTRLYGICATPRLDSQGRVITLCLDVRTEIIPGLRLVLLDGENLDMLAERRIDDAPIATVSGGNVPGGTYPHVDLHDRVITGSLENQFNTFEVAQNPDGSLRWDLTESVDLSSYLEEGDVLFDVAPDFGGTVWFASGLGRIGYIDPGTGEVFTTDLTGEKVENGIAIGEDGVFIVTSAAGYRFEVEVTTRQPVYSWREPYEVDPNPKPGVLSDGSGGTVTLIGRDLITYPDNAVGQVNLLVLRRDRDYVGDRLVCKVPLFEPGASGVDASPIGYARSIVVANFFGAPDTLDLGADYTSLEPGLTRIDIRPDFSGCDVVWDNDEIRSTTPAKLSTATGLIYTFRQRLEEEPYDAYYMTAVDFETGEIAFEVLLGTGALHTNGGLTTAVGPNGVVYQANIGGIVRVADGVADYWREYDRLLRSGRRARFWDRRSRSYSLFSVREGLPWVLSEDQMRRLVP